MLQGSLLQPRVVFVPFGNLYASFRLEDVESDGSILARGS